jgi:hypothetical protein
MGKVRKSGIIFLFFMMVDEQDGLACNEFQGMLCTAV